jgi:hypothetical protein
LRSKGYGSSWKTANFQTGRYQPSTRPSARLGVSLPKALRGASKKGASSPRPFYFCHQPFKSSMKIETAYRILVAVLLAGILAVQIAILIKTSHTVTLGECLNKNLSSDQRIALLRNIPVVRVNGTVDVEVQNSVDVNDISPINVHIVK